MEQEKQEGGEVEGAGEAPMVCPAPLSACDYASLLLALKAAGSEERTITVRAPVVIPPPPLPSLVVPRNVTLELEDTGAFVVAGGATLGIQGKLVAPLRTIFRNGAGGAPLPGEVKFGPGLVPRVYPQWFGADGGPAATGSTAAMNNTAAINAAVGSLAKDGFQPAGGVAVGGTQAIVLVQGHYRVSGTITVGGYTWILSEGKAIVEQTEERVTLLFSGAYGNLVRGLQFVGGRTHIVFQDVTRSVKGSASDTDTTTLVVEHCEFHSSSGFAIQLLPLRVPPLPAGAEVELSVQLTIAGCKFVGNGGVLQFGDKNTKQSGASAVVRDSWVTTAGAIPVGAPRAMFETHDALTLENVVGVPGLGALGDARWIDNYGSVFAYRTRFGGEGGGMPIVFHFAELMAGYTWTAMNQIVIRDCAVFCGPTSLPPGSRNANPYAAVINIGAGCPQRVVFEGNSGPADGNDNRMIQILPRSGFDLASYLAAHVQSRIEISIDTLVNPGPLSIPPELLPFVNVLDAAPFGPGPQPGIQGAPGHWRVGWSLPKVMSGFVAIATISAVYPAGGSQPPGSTAASYMVSLTTGLEGGKAVDMLYTPTTPVFQPPTPGLDGPTNVKATFTSTGGPTRPAQAQQDERFAITWDAPGAVTSCISLQVLHVISWTASPPAMPEPADLCAQLGRAVEDAKAQVEFYRRALADPLLPPEVRTSYQTAELPAALDDLAAAEHAFGAAGCKGSPLREDDHEEGLRTSPPAPAPSIPRRPRARPRSASPSRRG